MSATATILTLSFVALLLANCRGTLPPTEPHRVGDDGSPATRANDAPLLGPLTVDAPVLALAAASGSGGTSVLPPPPGPPPGGGGAGGAAGSGVR
jgi:hypothetical protein